MFKLLLLAVIVAIIGFALQFFAGGSNKQKTKSIYNYKRKDFLMSRAEHEFFDILVEAVGGQYHVFPQVHLPTFLEHRIKNGQSWKGAKGSIDRRSVDFLICDKAYIKPLLAIELDDKSHDREDRIERDENIERILNDAGLPLLRFRNNGSFNKEEIKETILQKVSN